MLRSLLIGSAAGSRALTPLAVISDAARRRALRRDGGAPAWLGSPITGAVIAFLAAGEVLGDKLRSAPDRIVPAGLAARAVTGGIAGAALAPRGKSRLGAVLGASSAVAAAYLTFALRRRAMRRFGQTPTGLVEDGLTLALSQLVLRGL